MKPSSLQLNHCIIGDVSLRANDGNTGAQVNVTTNVNYGRSESNPRQWQIKLNVMIKTPVDQPPAPYEGEINVTGIFTILGDSPEDQQLKLIAVSGASILYGTAREMFAMISARGKNGTFLIPSVSFADQKILPADGKPVPATTAQ